MRTSTTLRLAVPVLFAAGATTVGVAAPAAAEERVCRGTIGAVTLDNIRVPSGATCVLRGTRVIGTVKAETRSTLRTDRAVVNGNVQAEGARSVGVARSRVGGSIQVVQGGPVSITDTRVTGDILLDENRGRSTAARNVLGGSLQAFQNTGGLAIVRNTIDGNLQCKENRPAPTGGGNRVQGNKEDQCARL